MTEYVEIDCDVLRSTDKAIQILKGSDTFWVPLSLLEEEVEVPLRGATISVPVWFAEKEGLV